MNRTTLYVSWAASFLTGAIFSLLLVTALTDHAEIQFCLDMVAAVKETQPIYPKP